MSERRDSCLAGNGESAWGIFRRPARLFAPGGFFETELLNPIANLIAIEAEQRGGPGVIPARTGQRLDDQLAFHLLEAEALIGQIVVPRCRSPRNRHWKVLRFEPVAVGEKHRSLDGVSQFPDVARPPVSTKQFQRRR